MYTELLKTIDQLQYTGISEERKLRLQALTEFIQSKLEDKKPVNLNFICTHNSRRSHLSQVWAQAASAYFGIPGVTSYSGGTEETSVFPEVLKTLKRQGFSVHFISGSVNPVYAIKYAPDSCPVICFSKKYDHPFNPDSGFAAIMTCSQADGECPYIAGADQRIPLTYLDPKISDHSSEQVDIYAKTSLQIGAEIFYAFSKLKY